MLASHRELFEVPREIAYLNNGSFTPLPRTVRAAGRRGVAAKSTPWTMNPEAIASRAEKVRAAAAGFIGAQGDDIAIVHSAAYRIATAAANLRVERSTRILLIEGEFPSLSLEWARLAEARGATLDLVRRPADGDWTAALLARIEAPGLPPVGIAALTPLVWTDGSLIDLERLAPKLRGQGAAIVVDATQGAGVLPIDVHRIGADSSCSRPTNGCSALTHSPFSMSRHRGRADCRLSSTRTIGWAERSRLPDVWASCSRRRGASTWGSASTR